MIWMLEHWTRVFEPCAGNDGDFVFEKESVKVTRAEKFTFAPLFQNPRSSTKGWRVVEYKDPMRRAVALMVMHILNRNARPTSQHGRSNSLNVH